jgi:arylsulfate sulfotransferase
MIIRSDYRLICIAVAGLACTAQLATALSVRLDPPPASSVRVGEQVILQAIPETGGDAQYQFSVTPPSASSYVLRDFTRNVDHVEWTPLTEGWHVLRVVAVDASTGEAAPAETGIQVTSRIGPDNQPVLTPTTHPLVFLYSAPPCDIGVMTAHFAKSTSSAWQYTRPQVCDGLTSRNFWIAGLEPDTDYRISHQVWTASGGMTEGPQMTFHTGTIAAQLRAGSVMKSDPNHMDLTEGILLESQILGQGGSGAFPVARLLDGPVIWYYDQDARGALQNMLRPLDGGNMFVIPAFTAGIPAGFREIDLAGNLVRETNVDAISARLAALGIPPVSAFHHDALRLPHGNILVLTQSQRVVPAANPGDPDRNVLGDVIVLLNENFDVLWVWDSFQKLDVNRRAILGETSGPSGPTDPTVEDWTHGNALQYLADGNILFSIRHQDWVVKIDFRDGAGSGDVLWRMGKDGDFTIDSTDPYPWFSHQHNAQFDGVRLWLYDNGDTRYQANGQSGNSRGQVYVVDEGAKTAQLELNADLGQYSTALGSAQRLSNGNYHFLSGLISTGDFTLTSLFSQSLEVSADGTIRYIFQVVGPMYRSFRMPDLYSPPQ